MEEYFDNKLKVNHFYYVEDPKFGSDFFMIGKAHSQGRQEGDYYRSNATFINPKDKEFVTANDWAYKSEHNRTFRKATDNEADWLRHCIEKGKFFFQSELVWLP